MEDSDKKEEMPERYIIPDNFLNSGRLFNGMIETRNLLEAIAVTVVLGFIEWVFLGQGSFAKMVAIMVITIGPFFIAGLVGINGDSLSQFIILFINFLKNKRKLRYRRIMKNAKTTSSRAKSRPTNPKKAARSSSKK